MTSPQFNPSGPYGSQGAPNAGAPYPAPQGAPFAPPQGQPYPGTPPQPQQHQAAQPAKPAATMAYGAQPASASPQSTQTATNPATAAGHGPLYHIAVVLLSIALVVGVGIGAFMLFGNFQDEAERAGLSPVNNMKDTSGIQNRLDEAARNSMFSIGISKEIVFETPTGQGLAKIQNYADSPFDMQVTISLGDDGQVIYESGLVSPGESIQYIELAQELDPGTYDCEALFTALDQKTGSEIGRTVIGTKVTIE